MRTPQGFGVPVVTGVDLHGNTSVSLGSGVIDSAVIDRGGASKMPGYPVTVVDFP